MLQTTQSPMVLQVRFISLVNAIVGFDLQNQDKGTIVQCGSTAVELKICDWGEFDFPDYNSL